MSHVYITFTKYVLLSIDKSTCFMPVINEILKAVFLFDQINAVHFFSVNLLTLTKNDVYNL